MAVKKALIFLAPGAEEIEFTVAADVLVRGGVEVTVASVGAENKDLIKCSRGVIIKSDCDVLTAYSKGPYDALIMPGGLGGAKTLSESPEVGKMLKEQYESGRLVAAICAAPTALKAHSIGIGKQITSYPSLESAFKDSNYIYKTDDVVVDDNLITSRGPGTSFKFALTIVEKLAGKDKAQEVSKAMLL